MTPNFSFAFIGRNLSKLFYRWVLDIIADDLTESDHLFFTFVVDIPYAETVVFPAFSLEFRMQLNWALCDCDSQLDIL